MQRSPRRVAIRPWLPSPTRTVCYPIEPHSSRLNCASRERQAGVAYGPVFFDFFDGTSMRDAIGHECGGYEDIRHEAMKALPEIAKGAIP
ncbi:DUF6894 family protein [Methylobacterium sp. M6A4_1b]